MDKDVFKNIPRMEIDDSPTETREKFEEEQMWAKVEQEDQLRSSLGAFKSDKSSKSEKQHWLWDSWVLLSLVHAAVMTIRELMIGEFTELGL